MTNHQITQDQLDARADTLVRTEVFYNVSQLISELSKDDKYQEALYPILIGDDWEAAASDAGFTEQLDGTWANLQEPPVVYSSAQECCESEGIDAYTVEAYEHWIISDYLADKLEAKGEMVLRDFLGLTIWGRTTTGQAISMDYVIQSVAKDLLRP